MKTAAPKARASQAVEQPLAAAEFDGAMLRLETIAAYYGISPQTIRRAIKSGQLKALKNGARIRVLGAEAKRWARGAPA